MKKAEEKEVRCIHSSSASISSYCLIPFLVLFLMLFLESGADSCLLGAAH